MVQQLQSKEIKHSSLSSGKAPGHHLANAWSRLLIGKLATLCDDPVGLTCSMDVARRWGAASEISPCASFEAASLAVKLGHADAFLVPGAYPGLNAFIMDSALSAGETFIMKIPPLVLASPMGHEPDVFESIFHHQAVSPLLSEISTPWRSAVHAPSNSEACRMALAAMPPSACITNALCASHFGLKTLVELRDGISMPWICFTRSRPIGNALGDREAST